jgi:hypothetical protein
LFQPELAQDPKNAEINASSIARFIPMIAVEMILAAV